jgi:galactose mutarotase-like enzyme
MSAEIREDMYKDVECVVLENDDIRVVVIPQSGGKIQSIFDKKENYEHLYQSPNEKYILPYYGATFEQCDFSGFDDMFPNILGGYYPHFPWKGTELPDHGEVWTLPFDCTKHNDHVILRCSGVKIPYTFEKDITLEGTLIKIKYKVTNHTNFDFKFIWAAHALKNIDEYSEILLPDGIEKIFNTFGGLGVPDVFGTMTDWHNEEIYGKISPPGTCKKYYVYGTLPKGECALYNSRTRRFLKFIYPNEKVPYLGVWINNGGYYGQKNVAIEPCTGAFDLIDAADRYGWISTVKAKDSYQWYLNVEPGTEEDRKKVVR